MIETWSEKVVVREVARPLTREEIASFRVDEDIMVGVRLVELTWPNNNLFIGLVHPHFTGLEDHHDGIIK